MGTLLEALNGMDSQELVYLGAQSSLFEIATAGELLKNMESLSKTLEESASRIAKTAKTEFYRALRSPPIWVKKEGQSEEESITQYIDMLFRWPNRLKSKRNRMRSAEVYAQHFVPLKDRTVKSVYPRMDGTGVCVIISGNEHGSYWFLEEKAAAAGRRWRCDELVLQRGGPAL